MIKNYLERRQVINEKIPEENIHWFYTLSVSFNMCNVFYVLHNMLNNWKVIAYVTYVPHRH